MADRKFLRERDHRPNLLNSHDEINNSDAPVTTAAMTDNELRQAFGAAVSLRNVAQQRLLDATKYFDELGFEMKRRGLLPHGCVELTQAAALANERRKGRNAKF